MKDNTLEFKKREKPETPKVRVLGSIQLVTTMTVLDSEGEVVEEVVEDHTMTRDQLLAIPQGPATVVGQTMNYAMNFIAAKAMEHLQRFFTVAELKVPQHPGQGSDTIITNGPVN